MMKKNRKGFTLIELLAVLVVLAILALITTPIILSIIKNARTGANERSAEGYERALDYAVSDCFQKNPEFIEGENLYLKNDGSEVYYLKDKTQGDTESNRETCSTVEYKNKKDFSITGDNKITSTKKGITVGDGTSVLKLGKTSFKITEGKVELSTGTTTSQTYNLGEVVQYKGIDFRVIKDNGISVTLLKSEPLTYEQTTSYGSTSTYKTTNGYGGAYFKQDNSTNNYDNSDVKNVVDNWAKAELNSSDLVEDSNGYKVRLLTYEELVTSFGYDVKITSGGGLAKTDDVPTWVYNSDYDYWTMSPYKDESSYVWYVSRNGNLGSNSVDYDTDYVVRPVITVLKSKLQ